MAGILPDSTPGIRPSQWLEVLQGQEAAADFSVQLQLLTDEQLISSSAARLNKALNQPATGAEECRRRQQLRMKDGVAKAAPDADASNFGAESDVSGGESIEDGVASTNAATHVSRNSDMSHKDPNDQEFGDHRSDDRSVVDSAVGLEVGSEEGEGLEAGAKRKRAGSGKGKKDAANKGTRLTPRALDALNALHKLEPYNEMKRKLRKHLDKRRTGRVTGTTDNDTQGLPSCFHLNGLYDPRLGTVEVRREGANAGRWTIWCATCNMDKGDEGIPACGQCGGSLMHSSVRKGKKKVARKMQCVACGAEANEESRLVDPTPSCPGHHGHMKVPKDLWLVNPLQWDDVLAMLRGSCWWCHRWRAATFDITRKVASLRLLNARLWTPGLEEVMDQKFSVRDERWNVGGEEGAEEPKVVVKKKGFNKYPKDQAAKAGEDLMEWVFNYIVQAETAIPEQNRPSHGLMFAKRREVVNQLWRTIASVTSSSACRHCGLMNPKRVTDLKKSAVFYDMSGTDMNNNIDLASAKEGPIAHTTWERLAAKLKTFKSETEINKGGGQVVHYKKEEGKYGKSKPLREAAPRGNVYLPPHELKDKIQGLFLAEQESLGEIFYHVCSSPDAVDPNLQVPPKDYWKAFLHQVVEIGPNKFRPFREGGDRIQADDQTKQISNILAACKNMYINGQKLAKQRVKKEFIDISEVMPSSSQSPVLSFWKARPRTFEFCARAAQDSYRRIMFAQADSMGERPGKGAQQIFEKKSGLFRTNLMGKRVNQACRSVISPDNSLEDDQVMLSRRFAKRLSIPEVLPTLQKIEELEKRAEENPHLATQVDALKKRRGFLLHSILNGAKVYPGATRVEMDTDNVAHLSLAFAEVLKSHRPNWMKNQITADEIQLIDVAKLGGTVALETVLWIEKLISLSGKEKEWTSVRFKVFRHVATGDWVVLNRQPTLHKSSWLGERVVVCSHERTIRFHYANCKGFNADFDGDEMNIHVPQTERAQVELRTLNSARKHFISSTSGKPLRGLIQDHVVAGVLACSRDTFLSGSEFDRLVHATLHKLADTQPPRPEPAVRVKKKQADGTSVWVEAWTGKQLVTVILQFVTKNFSEIGKYASGVCFEGRTALPATAWDPRKEKPAFVKDKWMEDDHVEVVYDTFVRGLLDKNQLGATGGTLVQHVHEVHGHEAAGTLTCCFGRLLTEYLKYHGFSLGICDLKLTKEGEEERKRRLKALDDSTIGMETEAERLGVMMKLTGELNKDMFPNGMAKQYPENCLAMMTMSGAKGSGVNSTQMACLLGQQTFDGHRVESMPSGKTLPGTLLGDDRATCGGFGAGRFLSGIRPQQYVVHAAAGRDGLIDTAVKTSRSGYLQRSCVKGMEGLSTKYMLSTNADGQQVVNPAVIDEAGGIVQFTFGHDGLDPQRSAGWKAGQEPEQVKFHTTQAVIDGLGRRKRAWRSLPNESLQRELDQTFVSRKRPGSIVHGEGGEGKKVKFMDEASNKQVEVKAGTRVQLLAEKKEGAPEGFQRIELPNGARGSIQKANVQMLPTETLKEAVSMASELRVMKAKMACDEPVGVIAGQSVGEPSTQMTLNTFHQAGQTVSHVTEGIPRLRAILQSASVSEPMVLLPVEKMDRDVAKALLKLHVLMSPKPLSDLTHEALPFNVTTVTTGPGQKYKKVKVTVNFDESRLLNYYVGPHGVVSCPNFADLLAGKKVGKKNDWEHVNSEYHKVREALGAMKLGTPAAPTKDADLKKDRCVYPVPDKKVVGAVGDFQASLKQVNRALMTKIKRSWNWDKTHDATGFDARVGTCEGETNPLVEDMDREYVPGAKSTAAEPSKKKGGITRPANVKPYGTGEIQLLGFDDITGCLEQKVNVLSLPSTRSYQPYAAGVKMGDHAAVPQPAAAVETGAERQDDADGEDADDDEAAAKAVQKTPVTTREGSSHSLSLSIHPHGVSRCSENPNVLQYHLTLTVPNHLSLVCPCPLPPCRPESAATHTPFPHRWPTTL